MTPSWFGHGLAGIPLEISTFSSAALCLGGAQPFAFGRQKRGSWPAVSSIFDVLPLRRRYKKECKYIYIIYNIIYISSQTVSLEDDLEPLDSNSWSPLMFHGGFRYLSGGRSQIAGCQLAGCGRA